MSDATDNRFYREPAAPMVAGHLRERVIDKASDVLADAAVATQDEGSERLADAMLAVVQPELERLTKLADANGGQARFWANHFAEIEKANRDALGAHHKPGYRVDELITALVGELDREKKCYSTAYDGREHAWGELERISKLMGVEDDDFAVEAVAGEVERYVDQVKLVTERLTRERDEAQQSLEAAHRELADYQQQYADLWRDATAERIQFDRVLTHLVPAARQVNGTISGLVLREQAGDLVKKLITDLESRPAIPADAVVLPDNWETQIRQALHARAYDISEAGPLPGTSSHDRDADRCADEIAGDVVVMINDWMSAPVSGSDTTEDGGPR